MDGNSTNGSGSAFVSRHRNDSSSFIRRENEIVIAERRGDCTNVLQTSDTSQETNEDSEIEEKILTVYWRAGKLGAAYFTLQTGELYILEEIVDRPPSHQMLANLYRQVEPAQVLLDGKLQGSLAGALKELVFDNDGQGDGRCKLVFLKSKENSFEACKRRILSLSLPNEPHPCSEEERTMFLRTVVDFSQTQSVHALGALLRYVDLNWSSLAMDLHSKPEFLCLRRISLTDIVTIDEDTYKGLQIFSSIAHPSNFKKGVQGSNKEGMSLYHLFNKCSSKVGQSRMRVLLQHPSNNLEVLKRRQDVVAFFMRGQNDSLLRNICSCLRYVRNVTGILAKIKALSAKPFQWKSLYNTLYNTVLICEMCESVSGASEFLAELGSYDNTKLYEMALYMNRIIDFESSKTEGKFTVKPGVDPELDKKKQIMANLHGLMSETAKIELSRLPQFVQACSMVYMPHLGYLLSVKLWQDNLTAEEKDIPNLRFMFQNNDYIHYKSKGCEELDVLIGDTWPEIVAHETRLKMRLSDLILQSLHALHEPIDKCAELDCLIAISKVCREHNFVRPTMVADKIIDIKQGRHPLHALRCDSFVPNDLVSSGDGSLVKILTGPNASGKSVYMKQIGLIVYLAHIGSFVPAESATIGVLSHIHTRVQSIETIAAHMSAFLIDLRQMSLALQESTSNSLILIDEFGKGTSEVDGIALLASCINSVLCREENCPHVLVATHMLQLPKYIISTPLVRFQQFEHLLQEDGEAVFLFRLTDGSVSSSFAHQVAASSGIEPHIVDRAKHVMECLMNNSLPKENNKITSKLKTFVEIVKNDLLTETFN